MTVCSLDNLATYSTKLIKKYQKKDKQGERTQRNVVLNLFVSLWWHPNEFACSSRSLDASTRDAKWLFEGVSLLCL